MKEVVYKQESIELGITSAVFAQQNGEFSGSVAIDPNKLLSVFGSTAMLAPALNPTATYSVSVSVMDAVANWITSNPVNVLWYTYLIDGKVISYNSDFASETLVGTATSSSGNGFAYYNDYIYAATNTDIARYGPLSGSPTFTNGFWTTTLSKTALNNTTYNLNHAMHFHAYDNRLYFLDYANGQGLVHFIQTNTGSNHGQTDAGSVYGALSLPFGYYPSDLESFGTNLVIAISQNLSNSGSIKQGDCALVFWDCFSPTFYGIVFVKVSKITALLNVDGVIHGWGTGNSGVVKFYYTAGTGVIYDTFLPNGQPPTAAAVDSVGNVIGWAGMSVLSNNGSVPVIFTKNYSNPKIPNGQIAVQSPATARYGGNSQIVAFRFVNQTTNGTPVIMSGSFSGSSPSYGLDANYAVVGATINSQASEFITQVFIPNQPFRIKQIKFPMQNPISGTDQLQLTLWVDNIGVSLGTVTTTNFNNASNIVITEQEINNAVSPQFTQKPQQWFALEIQWQNKTLNAVRLPIEFIVELDPDVR